jgi:hypothetical protein
MVRYSIVFPLENGTVVELSDIDLPRAIQFAQRISEGDWWEVVDGCTANIVASSESERKGKGEESA